MKPDLVTIDGPAGSGKSTVSRELAKRLGWTRLDTGAIYRAVAWAARDEGVSWDDSAALGRVARALELRFSSGDRVLLAGKDVSSAIRTLEISDGASRVSQFAPVREALLALQRRAVQGGRVVAEGRDMGTVVFPDAPVKFFLTAAVNERARRRWEELTAAGHSTSLEDVEREVILRDQRDSERDVAPLKPADDAIVMDSSALTIAQVVEKMRIHVQAKLPGTLLPGGSNGLLS